MLKRTAHVRTSYSCRLLPQLFDFHVLQIYPPLQIGQISLEILWIVFRMILDEMLN
jgi:hypothetical protein